MVKDQYSGSQNSETIAYGAFTADNWHYAVASITMTSGKLSTCTVYKSNSNQGAASFSNDIFMIDYAAWPAYLFGAREGWDNNPTSNKYGGYIYEFAIYNTSSNG